jgi:hypothetical protein
MPDEERMPSTGLSLMRPAAAFDTYWYVKARHRQTGKEVQRISMADGASTALDAIGEMARHLRQTGRVDGDIDLWEIVEVSRWPRPKTKVLADAEA